jgi:hypothetical protein
MSNLTIPNVPTLLKGIVTDDPLVGAKSGETLRFANVASMALGGGTTRAQVAGNWQVFEGALLGTMVGDSNSQSVVGSAAMVAPGLAVTATHNLRDDIDALLAGELALYLVGVRSSGLEFWTVRHVSLNEQNDLALLSVIAASPLPPDRTYWKFGMTTRTPREGEDLIVLGFVEDRGRRQRSGEVFGGIYGVTGKVVHVYHRRDSVLMPFPTIEIACGSLGGMSGGPVLDKQGHLVGLVSRGLDTEDGEGPTFVSWIIDGLHRKIPLEWPQGLHKSPSSLLELDDLLATIVGRHAVEEVDGQTAFRIWFD